MRIPILKQEASKKRDSISDFASLTHIKRHTHPAQPSHSFSFSITLFLAKEYTSSATKTKRDTLILLSINKKKLISSIEMDSSIKSFKGYGKVDEIEEQAFKKKTRKRLIIVIISSMAPSSY